MHRAMAQNRPCALISEVGREGLIQEAVDLMKQHFEIITHRDFLQNPSLSSKIQVVFLWDNKPKPDSSLISSLPALKVIANGGVGIDHLDVPRLNALGIRVSNTPHVVSNATADMAMGLLLASARMIVEGHLITVDPKTTRFPGTEMGFEVTGSTLGIIGMGHIGFKIAQRGRGFDMKILYHNRNKRSCEDEQAVGAVYCKNMEDLLREADFVVLAVNLTPQTTGLIGHKELSLMKTTATLVNISRGRVVDQDALVEALQKRTIRAAALDVTYPEPLPRDHPLLHLPNIIITPHIGTDTLATTLKMVQTMVDNALAAVQGQQIPNEVKPL
ncbi:probable 2-ketogluconate reductase isoform X1 [Periophthalmus magnuspinnatus]|uniref:probable 2-ketogluconate reductase isoform X1 n=2 Tax=Periophthalmus magnuspinnatus TaxID=409849 RepID=UPI0024373B66|nr:probable 2-ketogluconate reductase isoform X1 [Periophthalmus magnuspinnatus]